MSIAVGGIFDIAQQRLAWTDRRHAVLAQNIANADTPGWRARDVKQFNQLLGQASISPVQTHAMHLTSTDGGFTEVEVTAGLHAPDGNAVGIEAQLTKLAENDATHELVSDLYKKYMGFFRTVIGH